MKYDGISAGEEKTTGLRRFMTYIIYQWLKAVVPLKSLMHAAKCMRKCNRQI